MGGLDETRDGPDRAGLARDVYRAFATGDRELIETLLARDFVFSSPPDPQLDRDGYFERCWPQSGNGNKFEFVRLIESGDEVVVTYEATRVDGTRFRNTEVLSFDGDDKVVRAEVYFGWNLD
jgi:ketosteroid isomerase-like protein